MAFVPDYFWKIFKHLQPELMSEAEESWFLLTFKEM